MKDIQYELFKLFKKNPREIPNNIRKIINKEYNFSYEDVSSNELAIYIEKIIVMVVGPSKISNNINDNIRRFMEKLNDVNYDDINWNSLVSVKYDLRIINEKYNKSIKKAKTIFASTILIFSLSSIIFNLNSQMIDENIDNKAIEKNENSISLEAKVSKPDFTTYSPLPSGDIYNKEDDSVIFENNTDINKTDDNTVILEDSREEKINAILEEYDLTKEQFQTLCAIVSAESEYHNYDDSYAIINTIYNRTISKNWNSYISHLFKKDVGGNVYYQAIAPGQFDVYCTDGRYKEFLGEENTDSEKAIIDFLTTKKVIHNYLSFKAAYSKINGEQFSPHGNKYHDVIPEDDRIEEAAKTK